MCLRLAQLSLTSESWCSYHVIVSPVVNREKEERRKVRGASKEEIDP